MTGKSFYTPSLQQRLNSMAGVQRSIQWKFDVGALLQLLTLMRNLGISSVNQKTGLMPGHQGTSKGSRVEQPMDMVEKKLPYLVSQKRRQDKRDG